jgi:hypothetical protein
MFTKVLVYFLSLYVIYLYLSEILLEYHIKIPVFESTYKFDIVLLSIGGIVLGILLIKFGGIFNKYFGIGMMLLNVIVGAILLMKALV